MRISDRDLLPNKNPQVPTASRALPSRGGGSSPYLCLRKGGYWCLSHLSSWTYPGSASVKSEFSMEIDGLTKHGNDWNSPFYNRKYIYIVIQMSLVSVAGGWEGCFFFGGELHFLGCKFTAWYFVYPFFWDYTVGWRIVSHPRQTWMSKLASKWRRTWHHLVNSPDTNFNARKLYTVYRCEMWLITREKWFHKSTQLMLRT